MHLSSLKSCSARSAPAQMSLVPQTRPSLPHRSRSERTNTAQALPDHRLPSAPLTCRRRHSHGLLETPDNLAGLGVICPSLSGRPQHRSDPPTSPVLQTVQPENRASAARVLQIRGFCLSSSSARLEDFPIQRLWAPAAAELQLGNFCAALGAQGAKGPAVKAVRAPGWAAGLFVLP